MNAKWSTVGLAMVVSLAGCGRGRGLSSEAIRASLSKAPIASTSRWNMSDQVVKSEAEWRKELSPEQYRVLREHGTERAFTGALWNNHEAGTYLCAGCGLELFSSETKFESGTGWPSFYAPIHPAHVGTTDDRSFFMRRIEVHCARCGGHLGHVFDDGPQPSGLRYCLNSAALKFEKK